MIIEIKSIKVSIKGIQPTFLTSSFCLLVLSLASSTSFFSCSTRACAASLACNKSQSPSNLQEQSTTSYTSFDHSPQSIRTIRNKPRFSSLATIAAASCKLKNINSRAQSVPLRAVWRSSPYWRSAAAAQRAPTPDSARRAAKARE